MSVRTAATMLTFALAFPLSSAGAQYPQIHKGFWFNGDVGYGSLGCIHCSSQPAGLTTGFSLGTTLSQKVLLGIGAEHYYRNGVGGTHNLATLDLRARFYATRNTGFFITAGIGAGNVSSNILGTGGARTNNIGPAALVGVGFDFRVRPMLSVTPFYNVLSVLPTLDRSVSLRQFGLSITAH